MKAGTEKRTIRAMISIYCRKNHGSSSLCGNCIELLEYSFSRIDKCPFAEDKPACSKCTVHCYSQEKREKIRKVMRFAGPRMPLRHPYYSLLHF